MQLIIYENEGSKVWKPKTLVLHINFAAYTRIGHFRYIKIHIEREF